MSSMISIDTDVHEVQVTFQLFITKFKINLSKMKIEKIASSCKRPVK
jgi:hypothetical protein